MAAKVTGETVASPPTVSLEEVYKQLEYTLPEWAAVPPLSQHYYFNVIKDQMAIETLSVNDMLQRKSHLPKPYGNYCLFGRDECCDHIMKHLSTSRVHCICVYNNIDKSIYLYDRSTHGVSVNHQRIPYKKHFKLNIGDVVIFGESTRSYQLQCGQAHSNNNSITTPLVMSSVSQTNVVTTTVPPTITTTTATNVNVNHNSKRTFSQFQQFFFFFFFFERPIISIKMSFFFFCEICEGLVCIATKKKKKKKKKIVESLIDTFAAGNRPNFLGHTQFAKSTLLEDKSMNPLASSGDSTEPPNKIRAVDHKDSQSEDDPHKTQIRKNFEKRLKDGKNISKFSALNGKVTMEEQERYFLDAIGKSVRKRHIGSGSNLDYYHDLVEVGREIKNKNKIFKKKKFFIFFGGTSNFYFAVNEKKYAKCSNWKNLFFFSQFIADLIGSFKLYT
ncbi:forkhead-associated domain-containing protein / FHA domain-containing protein [Reticulomyxa filosa]|uniref:Forkhead-associated domain-containing protein / FHA domain-containing protein n=1 Tax=Reticulomyxa filosa TaxID=46433 RepID=X6M0V5_RETFI|nr:forkhead-associated domain-containing protein / FHA domain-containing protein [Reticulomyxa filosa]|eukprot:ETO07494.1 forkhead-associated domain-containing protein / FHA domain-containing protein [Reticulomyxa filosa]